MTSRSSARRAGAILLVLTFTFVLAACSSGGASPSVTAASSVGGQAPSTGAAAAGAPAIAPGLPEQSPAANASSPETGGGAGSSGVGVATGVATGVGVSGTGVASAASIAYPYFGGVSGVAPDHTIVVTGYGQATMQSDGSDRTAARSKALQAAIADARAQADEIAKLAGVSITGVLSVSTSSSGYAYPVPMAANGTSGVAVPPAAPSGISVLPGAAPIPSRVDLGVSVTIAYSIS